MSRDVQPGLTTTDEKGKEGKEGGNRVTGKPGHRLSRICQ